MLGEQRLGTSTFRQNIRDIEEQKKQREHELAGAEKAADKLREERGRLFGAKDPDAEEAAAEALARRLTEVKEQRRTAAEQVERAVQQSERDIARTQDEIAKGEKQLREIYAAALTECPAVAAVSDEPDTAARFEEWDSAASQLGEEPETDALRCALEALDALIAEQTAQKGAVAQILKVNAQSRSKLKSLKDGGSPRLGKNGRLDNLIGSANGDKFTASRKHHVESLLRLPTELSAHDRPVRGVRLNPAKPLD